VNFTGQQPLISQLLRLSVLDSPDPSLQLRASGGYENNDYAATTYRDTIYGAGMSWRPTDRTNLDLSWEHRFFGSSYLLNFSHRTPLTVWTFGASRNVSSYPQQLASLPVGFDVAAQLNQLFLGTIPDPAERQAFINQFIADRGLPPFLSVPVAVYTQQIILQEQATGSVAFIGSRNTVVLSVFYLKQQPITGAGNELPPALAALNNNLQEGVSASWSHTLSSRVNFVASANVSRSVPNQETTEINKTTQSYISASLSSSITAKTSLTGGVRYQVLHGNQNNGYTEAAAFVTLTHSFR
jgi:uncharacterized protein (PEP-CTERM system associated)